MKTVFITGANKGLGRGFVEYLLSQGFKVFAGARNPSKFDETLKANPNLTVVPLDITKDDSIANAFSIVKSEVNNIDYLINNAGINKDSATNNHKELVCDLNKLDRNILMEMYSVNTISPMMVIKQFTSLLKSNPAFIINISSNRSSQHDEHENVSGNYGYRASKSALNMMTFCSLFDLPENVQTFAVHPGDIKSDINPVGVDDALTQAEKIIKITENWSKEFNGKFLRYDGALYPL